MARVTVEDCIDKVDNRFELVVLAAQRAREINAGATKTVEEEGDKQAVVALREIAAGRMDMPQLRDSLIKSLQSRVENEEREILPQLEDGALELQNESDEMLRRLTANSGGDDPMMHFEDMQFQTNDDEDEF